MTITSDLDDAMSAVVVSLREPGDLADTLRRITRAAQDMVPGVDYASISIWRSGGTLETVAATDSLVDVVDALQYQLREGPCYDAVIAERFTGSGDLRSDFRWPTFGPRVAELGLVSQLAIRLHDDSAMRVGLNLSSCQRDAFEESRQVAGIFASHAKVALGYARKIDTLSAAIATRQVIGEAVGIVIERYGLDEERAFEFLIRLSQNSNVKLRTVAAEIVALTVVRPIDR